MRTKDPDHFPVQECTDCKRVKGHPVVLQGRGAMFSLLEAPFVRDAGCGLDVRGMDGGAR